MQAEPAASGRRVVLLTGRSGVGKTTAIRHAAELLDDLEIRGFYTEEVRDEEGRRTGFRALPFGRDGPGRLIASTDVRGGPRVSKYEVDVEAVDAVSDAHLPAGDADAVFVDEIGKMECYSDRFVARVRELVTSEVPMAATVARRGGGLIREVKEVPDSVLVEVTVDNRDRLPHRIAERIREETA